MPASIKDKPFVIKTALDDGDRWTVGNHTGTYTNDISPSGLSALSSITMKSSMIIDVNIDEDRQTHR